MKTFFLLQILEHSIVMTSQLDRMEPCPDNTPLQACLRHVLEKFNWERGTQLEQGWYLSISWILGLNKRKGGGSQPCTSICSFLLLDCRHKVTSQFMLKLPQLGAVLVTVTLPSLSQQTVTSNHKPQIQLQFSALSCSCQAFCHSKQTGS